MTVPPFTPEQEARFREIAREEAIRLFKPGSNKSGGRSALEAFYLTQAAYAADLVKQLDAGAQSSAGEHQ